MLSDLHYPSAALLPREVVRAFGRLAARHDARAVVDEVSLSGAAGGPVESAARPGERLVVTGRLTKSCGLGRPRAGRAAGPAALVSRLLEVMDQIGANRPCVADGVGVRAFARMGALAERARRRRAENWPLVEAAARLAGARLHPSAGGFMRLPEGLDADRLVDHLAARHDTLVVPGTFFGRPDHVRLGFRLGRELVAEALDRLVRAVAELD